MNTFQVLQVVKIGPNSVKLGKNSLTNVIEHSLWKPTNSTNGIQPTV